MSTGFYALFSTWNPVSAVPSRARAISAAMIFDILLHFAEKCSKIVARNKITAGGEVVTTPRRPMREP